MNASKLFVKQKPLLYRTVFCTCLLVTIAAFCPNLFARDAMYEREPLPFPPLVVSMAFHEVSVASLLKTFAQEHGANIILAEGIDRKISINFGNISLADAFKSILYTSGLDYIIRGGIIEVDTRQNINTRLEHFNNKMQSLKKKQDLELDLSQLETRIFFLKYTVNPRPTIARDVPRGGQEVRNLDELAQSLEKDVLSKRGKINVIEEKNSLMVTDIPEVLDRVAAILEKIDLPPPQIGIEARIVDISDDYVKEVGVQWGGSITRGDFTATGGQTTDIQEGGTVEGTGPATQGVGLSGNNFVANLPAGVEFARGASIGFLLTNGKNFNLDLQLSALEEDKKLKLIAKPQVITLDNRRAYIESGEEIPYRDFESEVTGGFSVEFKKAALQMEVTPHVLDGGERIMLDIIVADKEADFSRAILLGGEPPINTRSLTTQVMINNGDTVVIGGLKRETIQTTDEGVPFFSKIPLLGWLFRFKGQNKSENQLMIFITPKILPEEGVSADV